MNCVGYSGGRLGALATEEGSMAEKEQEKPTVLLNLGTASKSATPVDCPGELSNCGPLGPGGVQVYRVRVRRKPEPKYIELMEDQLELVAAKG